MGWGEVGLSSHAEAGWVWPSPCPTCGPGEGPLTVLHPSAFCRVGLGGPGVAESSSPNRGKQPGWARHESASQTAPRHVGGCTCVCVPQRHGGQLARLVDSSLISGAVRKLQGVGRSGKQYSLNFGDVTVFEAAFPSVMDEGSKKSTWM